MKKLISVAQKSYTSVYQINYSNLKNQVTKWHNELPNIKPYYAVKSLPLENILKHLALSNVNFDCASYGEIKQILDLGISSDRIIYANPYKSSTDIKYALDNKVPITVVDSVEELQKIKSIGKVNSNEKIELYVDNILVCIINDNFEVCQKIDTDIFERYNNEIEYYYDKKVVDFKDFIKMKLDNDKIIADFIFLCYFFSKSH